MLATLSAALAAEPVRDAGILDLSIEELLNLKITSVSKKEEKLAEAAAAIFVITADDIRRSGARSLPEVLRLAPGVDVESIGGGAYAVSIRGFNGRFANKLLVLQDGRSLYTRLFGGVFWERQQPVLEDIERIEIVRGPGAAVWGANAVNGVINIITRSSRDTTGVLLALAADDHGSTLSTGRFGGNLDDRTTYRVFAKAEALGNSTALSGEPDMDAWHSSLVGFRFDRGGDADELTLQGELLSFRSGLQIIAPAPFPPYLATENGSQKQGGGDLLGRWVHNLDDGADISLEAYLDHSASDVQNLLHEIRDVQDLAFQHHFHAGRMHDVVWGFGFRNNHDSIEDSPAAQFDPAHRTGSIVNLFLQDDLALTGDALHLTLGAKLERDSESGRYLLPDARLRWNLTPASTLWSGWSRAVRTPARSDQDVQYTLAPAVPPTSPLVPLTIIPVVTGQQDFRAERETAYEVGYRVQPDTNLSVDLTAYVSQYRELRTGVIDPAAVSVGYIGPIPYLRLPLLLVNGPTARAVGIETALDWRPSAGWRIESSYAHATVASHDESDVPDPTSSPHNILSLRSSVDLGRVRFDLWYRHVSARNSPDSMARNTTVPAYGSCDARVAWSLTHRVEFTLAGQNLLQSRHLEFVSDLIATPAMYVSRSVYAALRLAF